MKSHLFIQCTSTLWHTLNHPIKLNRLVVSLVQEMFILYILKQSIQNQQSTQKG